MINSPYTKSDKPCAMYAPCQTPEVPTTVCISCGYLRIEHSPITVRLKDLPNAISYRHPSLMTLDELEELHQSMVDMFVIENETNREF